MKGHGGYVQLHLIANSEALTVLKIGGVAIGSFWSNMMSASASIRVSVSTFCLTRTVNDTNPWPVEPLLGGRKPILGSTGGSPIASKNKHDLEEECQSNVCGLEVLFRVRKTKVYFLC